MRFSCFPVLAGCAEAQVIGNISAKKYQIPFMSVKVITSQMWDVFCDTVYVLAYHSDEIASMPAVFPP